MDNMEHVFLYMKEEIMSLANQEVGKILEETNELENHLNQQIKEEANKDVMMEVIQEKADIQRNAFTAISKNHNEKNKMLIQKRDEYVEMIFQDVQKKLEQFTLTPDYVEFIKGKAEKLGKYHHLENSIIYISQKDLKLEAEIQKAYGHDIKIEESPDIQIGGLMMENKKSKLVVDESLDNALKLQKEWFITNSGFKIR